jgi:ribosome-associated protein
MSRSKRNPSVDPVASGEKSRLAVLAALDKKADELLLLNVGKLSSFADYFLICTGRSNRQVQAIADDVVVALKSAGHPPLGVEGHREGKWILIDADDLIVHVFHEPIRAFYDLEGLWHQAERVDLSALEEESRKLNE